MPFAATHLAQPPSRETVDQWLGPTVRKRSANYVFPQSV